MHPVRFAALVILVLSGLTALTVSHVWGYGQHGILVSGLFILMSIYLGITAVTSMAHGRIQPTHGHEEWLASQRIAVVIPAYNEDPELLTAGLLSLARQTRIPDDLALVDDGSDTPILYDLRVTSALDLLRAVGVEVFATRQDNAGKRHAQVRAFRGVPADIYITLDSDTILDERAVEEIVTPLRNPYSTSVAGIAYGQNHKVNLLTRVIELGFAMSFISGRASEGFFGAVRVNCGVLAAYRGDVVLDNIDRYLDQTYLGSPAVTGDDRALTILARERGRTEYQPTAVAYSALPTKFSHLVRQRVRWARSWYWGVWWLLARPASKPEFWLTVIQIVSLTAYLLAITTSVVLAVTGTVSWGLAYTTVGVALVVGAVSTFRYVILGRRDVSLGDRLLTWLMTPFSTLLYMFVLTPLYVYAAFTLKKKKWGTRARVEVGLHSTP